MLKSLGITEKQNNIQLNGSLSPRHGASSGYGWRRRLPHMDGSYESI